MVIMRKAMAEPHRTVITLEKLGDRQIRVLAEAFEESVKREQLGEPPTGKNSVHVQSGPAGIRTPVTTDPSCPVRVVS